MSCIFACIFVCIICIPLHGKGFGLLWIGSEKSFRVLLMSAGLISDTWSLPPFFFTSV